jgi:Rap1a immunity proteins
MRRWLQGICLGAGLSIAQAQASESVIFIDGNLLLTACQSKRGETFQFCNGSIQAYFDTLSVDRKICPEVHIMARQAWDVVVHYLIDHPEERHHSAASIARTALSTAFPCND